jgi:hypothetical protein
MAGKPLSAEARLQQALAFGIQVDPEDAWILSAYTWRLDKDGYAVTAVRISMDTDRWLQVKLHHCIIGQPIYDHIEPDHINRVRLDNRRANLRWVTKREQALNRVHPWTLQGVGSE